MDATGLLFKPSQRGSAAQEVVNNVRTQRLRFGDFFGTAEKRWETGDTFSKLQVSRSFFFFCLSRFCLKGNIL